MSTHPLSIIPLIWHAKRPGRTADMKAVSNSFWLRGGYEALTFFGTIVTPSEKMAQQINAGTTPQLKNHEMIHLRQAQTTGNSWWRFYLLYIYYWMRALPQNRHMSNAAYRLNPFEMEAYAHMHEDGYLEKCNQNPTEWKQWASMKPAERRHWLEVKRGKK